MKSVIEIIVLGTLLAGPAGARDAMPKIAPASRRTNSFPIVWGGQLLKIGAQFVHQTG
jgi:hypothetical protein